MANNGSDLNLRLVVRTYASIIEGTMPDDFSAILLLVHGPTGSLAVESVGLEPDMARAVVAEALRFMHDAEPEDVSHE